ncbi:HEPN domain-containing protein, partial [Alkalilimnicola ehrlichii]
AEDANIRKALRDVCKSQGFSARVSPILHDIADVNANLSDGRYFFLDIKREGRLLYDAGRVELAEPRELTPVEAQRIVQDDFDEWYQASRQFYRGFEFFLQDNDLRRAIFNLNQATESAYKAILLVFTSYAPHEHLLEWLGERAALYGPVYRELFPQLGEKEKKRFELLDKAYIGARYKKAFPVFPGDIDYLAPRVKRLLELTESLCREEIERIGRDGVGP